MSELKKEIVRILREKHSKGSIYYVDDKAVMREPETDLTDEEVAQLILGKLWAFFRES